MWFPFFWSCHSNPQYIGSHTLLVPYHELNGKTTTFLGHEASLVSNSICSLLIQKDGLAYFWVSYVVHDSIFECVAAYSASAKFTLRSLDYAVSNYDLVKLHLPTEVKERYLFNLLGSRYNMCDKDQNSIVDLDKHACVFLSRYPTDKDQNVQS